MKTSSARYSTVSPKNSDPFNFRKFSSTRLLTTSSSRTLVQSKPVPRPKAVLSRSRDSPYNKNSPSRSRSALNLLLPLSSTFSSPSRTPVAKFGSNSNASGSVLKKYAKELFKRYDERTSELSKVQREKQELEKRLQELTLRVCELERERHKKDEQIRILHTELAKPPPHQGKLHQTMDEFRTKLKKFVSDRQCKS